MRELPVGTVTLFFMDIEGSTRLLQQLGERYVTLLEDCRSLVRATFLEYGGYEVDTQGDAFFVVFARATDAVAAAIACQRALFTTTWPDGVQLHVRMGLHTGEPQRSAESYVGLDVHHAARIMSAAHGGQVLLSQTTHDLVEHTLPDDVHLVDLGSHRLKDLQRPSRLFQLAIAGLPTEFPPLKTLDNSPNNLPLQPTPFIGREKEVAAVVALLHREDVRLVTLTGPGGTGKTRLGLQIAAELSTWFADGVFFVNLALLSDPALVISAVAQALEITEIRDQRIPELLKTALREKHLLLLMDNFEHVASAAALLADLLAACAKLKVLVTSREPLHLRAEQEYAVPTLTLPDPKHLPDLLPLSQYEAVTLFIERAQAVKSDFHMTNANAPAVAEICVRLDGLPLAIELAAARSKYFAPQALLIRLEQGLSVLTGGARDLPARQQTLRGAIAWSYDLLSSEEQSLFRRLAVFVDGCTIEAAEIVCQAAGNLERDVLDGLVSLVDKSLLLLREMGNKGDIVWVLFQLGQLALANGDYGQARALFEECLSQSRERDDKVGITFTLGGLGSLALYQGNLSQARTLLEECLSHSRELSIKGASAYALGELGILTRFQGDYSQAKALLEESLKLRHEMGDKGNIAITLSDLGILARLQGDYGQARALLEESVSLCREMGDKAGIAYCLDGLASCASEQGDPRRAALLFGAAEALHQAIAAPLPPVDRPAYEQAIASARAQMGEEAFAVAWEEGRTLTPDNAIAAWEQAPMPEPVSSTLQPFITKPPTTPVYPDDLTAREVEVLCLIAQGWTNPQIADHLVISPRTVNAHLTSIYRKIQVTTRSAATRYAIEHHLI